MEVPKIDDRDKNIQRVDTGESPLEFEATRVLYPEVDKEVPVHAGVEISAQGNLDQAFKKLRKPVEISSPKDAASRIKKAVSVRSSLNGVAKIDSTKITSDKTANGIQSSGIEVSRSSEAAKRSLYSHKK